ncbi:MAG: helix-turn-helix transcriptional regulator [Lachnospiraceae bacterium]|nr:helix-turn-helix transcriptional regulator [Lachnospiraceae bacterium]
MGDTILSVESFENIDNQHVLTHWHDSIELIYIIDGTMQCMINGKDYTLRKGSLCMINRRQFHRIYCQDENTCDFYRVFINPSHFTSNKQIYHTYIEPILSDETFSHIISSANTTFTTQIVHLMKEILDLEKLQPEGYELGVVALIHFIFLKLYSYYQSVQEKSKTFCYTDILLYRRMMDYIEENYSQKISLDHIAAAGNISRSKCCSIFKKYAQYSPVDFLNLYRLQQSTDLLKNTDDSIATIALDCGFGQQSYYNRLFFREYGMTPKEYRIQMLSHPMD